MATRIATSTRLLVIKEVPSLLVTRQNRRELEEGGWTT
jgi:hypothetical protein